MFSAHEHTFSVLEHTFYALELMFNALEHKSDAKKQKNILTAKLLYLFSKKFGYSHSKHYLCSTRTRQASLQCLNRRVVLFLYNEQ